MNATVNYLNGRVQVTTVPEEMRMSHWVFAPKVTDLQTGEVLLDLTGGLWDLMEVAEAGPAITLQLRKYPGAAPAVELTLTPGQSGGRLNGRQLDAAQLMSALESLA